MLRKLGDFFIELLQIIVFAVSIFLFIYLLVLQPHKIKGSSMEPNFHDGQYLLTDKVTYRFGEPKRGDVIVFKAPPNYKEEFIKRIIGLPGDTIMIKSGKIYVNGNEVKETYIPKEFSTAPGSVATEGKEIKIGTDSFFVVGDNRDHSLDSRNFGTITEDKITGRAWLIYWPPKDAGTIKSPEY